MRCIISTFTHNLTRVACGVALVSTLTQTVGATTELDSYIGLPVAQLMQALGDPLLRSPHALWYSRKTQILGGGYRQAPRAGLLGGLGLGDSDYEMLSYSNYPCDIHATIDSNGLVQSVDAFGPGCAEYIYLLRQRNSK
jgi:hypothetical protein